MPLDRYHDNRIIIVEAVGVTKVVGGKWHNPSVDQLSNQQEERYGKH